MVLQANYLPIRLLTISEFNLYVIYNHTNGKQIPQLIDIRVALKRGKVGVRHFISQLS